MWMKVVAVTCPKCGHVRVEKKTEKPVLPVCEFCRMEHTLTDMMNSPEAQTWLEGD